MKKLAFALTFFLLVFALMASPAFATKLKVSASARQRAAHAVVFKAKTTRRGKVRVTVYHKRRAVRTLHATRKSGAYVANWTGKTVAAGTYAYKVTLTTTSHTRSTRGSVKVKVTSPSTSGATSGSSATSGAGTGNGRWIGLWVPGCPSDLAPLEAAEAVDGTHTAVIHFFVSDSESFPTARCQTVASHGSVPLITLEFWSIGTTGLSAITDGSKDAYLRSFADAAKAYGGEVWLRPLHEMNGNWYPWGGSVGSNSASKFIAAWKHVHDIFVAEGASNVKFVWCPNNDSVPSGSANAISAYWPGDAYVDMAALDGYNAGTSQDWSSWRPFSDVFGASYATVTKLTSKPIFIAETSSVEQGGSKASWIKDMFSVIAAKFPRLTGVCWFDEDKTYDWRIDSSSASAAAFRSAIAGGF